MQSNWRSESDQNRKQHLINYLRDSDEDGLSDDYQDSTQTMFENILGTSKMVCQEPTAYKGSRLGIA